MYPTDDIRAAIEDFTGAVPDLDCKGDEIDEVHFCLSKDLQVRTAVFDTNQLTQSFPYCPLRI